MRVFVGCPVGTGVEGAATALSSELKDRAARLAPAAKLSWVPAKRFHVTVLFLGQVDDVQLDLVRRALAAPLRQAAFTATVEGAGVFPSSGPPRVIWAGLSRGRDAFVALHHEVRARLAGSLQFDVDHDARLHLTLARVKAAAGLRAPALLDGLESRRLGDVEVTRVTLFESRPGARGPSYIALADTPLGGVSVCELA